MEFRVCGVPKPGGSKTAFINKKTGRAIIVDACKKNKDWRNSVVDALLGSGFNGPPLVGPLRLDVTFFMPRPKYHFGTGKNAGVPKPDRPLYFTIKPDHIKLLRSTEDALNKILWADDSQIVEAETRKYYTDGTPGAIIRVTVLSE